MDFIEENSIRPSGFRSPDVKEKTEHFQWVVRSTDRTSDFYSDYGGSIPSRPTLMLTGVLHVAIRIACAVETRR